MCQSLLPEKVPIHSRIGKVVTGDVLQLSNDGARVDAILVRVLADVHRQLSTAGAKGEETLVLVEGGEVAVDQFGVVAHANGMSPDLGNVRLDATDAAQLVGKVL